MKPPKPCRLDGCDALVWARWLCRSHYYKAFRRGEIDPRGPADYGGNENRCWGCGELAPSGVCTRPHPDLDMKAARRSTHIVYSVDAPASYYDLRGSTRRANQSRAYPRE